MQVVVTGSTGLLGNNLVRLLDQKGHQVIGLVRSEQKGKWLLSDTRAVLVRGDMRDVPGFAQALNGCEAVCHTAAYFREYYARLTDHWPRLEEINVKGTLALMTEADARGVRRFVHVSSAGAIGDKPDGSPGDENSPQFQGPNLYLKSKVDGDAAIRAWRPQRGMEVVEILPGWIWGPGDAGPTGAGQLVLDFLARKLPGIADGGMCVVDARDVAAAMIAALDRGKSGDRYIVGGDYHSIADIVAGLEQVSGVQGPRRRLPHPAVMAYAWVVELYGRLTGRDVLVTRAGARALHAKRRWTSEKARRELGVTFRPVEETLRDVVAWYREHPLPLRLAS
jgi:dihydroflavonol-4-reductase